MKFLVKQICYSVCWKRTFAHGDTGQGAKHLGRIQDHIHIYSKSEQYNFNNLYVSYEKDYIENFLNIKTIMAEDGNQSL